MFLCATCGTAWDGCDMHVLIGLCLLETPVLFGLVRIMKGLLTNYTVVGQQLKYSMTQTVG